LTNKLIPVLIDNCAWDYFFYRQVKMRDVFPSDRFRLSQTNLGAYEINAIPDTGKDGSNKRRLKAYIQRSIDENQISTVGFFGFASVEPDGTLSPVQRCLGFDQGTFISDSAMAALSEPELKKYVEKKSGRPTGLAKNEADLLMVLHSENGMIITDERPDKAGPLRWAKENYGRVILFLTDAENSDLPLDKFVAKFVEQHFPDETC
jgi:hypothetical protein